MVESLRIGVITLRRFDPKDLEVRGLSDLPLRFARSDGGKDLLMLRLSVFESIFWCSFKIDRPDRRKYLLALNIQCLSFWAATKWLKLIIWY